jgi:glycosyltransferase involved in cell wall biosynthesis
MDTPKADYPNVSVVVPVYNAQRTISDCIESLLNLNYPRENFEIIAVDNASTDHTTQILSRYNSELKIFNEKKRGPAAARNKGIVNATGEVIAFTDSDCVVDREWLKNLVAPLRDDRVGIVGGKILAKNPGNPIEKFCESIHDHNDAINTFRPSYVITMNWASKLSVLKEAGLFNESFIRCEDCDLSFRIMQAGYRFTYSPNAVVYHGNEGKLRGLFREGYQHGFWSIKINKTHQRFVQKFGHPRINWHSYNRIISSFADFVKGINRDYSICYFAFNAGKKLGKLAGSARFGYLDL